MTQDAQPVAPLGASVPDASALVSDRTEIKRWQIARGVIQHEDGLVNNRLTWFLTIQGFFFAAIALGSVNLIGKAAEAKTGLYLREPAAERPSGGQDVGNLKHEINGLLAEVGELKKAIESQTSQLKTLQEKWDKRQPGSGKTDGAKSKD